MCCNCCKPQTRPTLDHNALARYYPKKTDLARPDSGLAVDYSNVTNAPDTADIIIGNDDSYIYDGGT